MSASASQFEEGDAACAAGSAQQPGVDGGAFARELMELLNREELRIVAASLAPGVSTSGSKEDIARHIVGRTELASVDIKNVDLRDLSLAQLMLAATGSGVSIKGSRSDIEAVIAASFLISQGDHPESESEITLYLDTRGLNGMGDFAALKRWFELYSLGRHAVNYEAMEIDQMLALVDLYGLRFDETCPRGVVVDALVAIRSGGTGAHGQSSVRWSNETAEGGAGEVLSSPQVVPQQAVIMIMLEILGADVDDSTWTKLLMLYLKHATPFVMDCFTESDVFNEVAQRWNPNSNWPDLAKLLQALLPDDSLQPADSQAKLPWKSQQARLSKSLFPGLMEKEVVQWSEAFAQNTIVVHKILTLRWEIEMLQPSVGMRSCDLLGGD
eukprot:2431956-Rhodomonas_salina.1